MVEDRKVRDRRDFIIPLCVFGWKEGKMKEYKTNLFSWEEKQDDKKN